jgi:6-phosphogluconolactonase (cycloisomerase 2 family)
LLATIVLRESVLKEKQLPEICKRERLMPNATGNGGYKNSIDGSEGMRFLVCGKWRWIISLLLLVFLGAASFSVLAVPRFAYTANYFGSTVSIYSVDSDTGMLRHRSHVPTVKSPSSVILHPSGKFLYAISQATDKIAIYHVNAKTGALTETDDSRVHAGVRSSFQLAISPDGQFLYVPGRFTADFVVHRINQDTGALTLIENTDYSTRGKRARFIGVTPNGKFIYVSNTDSDTLAAFKMDANGESAAAIDGMPFKTGDAPQAVLLHPSGKFLYVSNWRSADISAYAINASTGELSPISGSKVETGYYPFKGSIHPSGKYLYVANWASSDISAFLINQQTGVLSLMPNTPIAVEGRGSPVTVHLDRAGRHAYVPDYDNMDIKVFDVDQESGQLVNQRRLYGRPGVRGIAILEGKSPVQISTQWMIAADRNNKTIASYAVDSASSKLQRLHQLQLEAVPAEIALYADAGLIFVTYKQVRRIDVLTIDKAGKITKRAEASKQLADGMPVGLRVDARGRHLYVITQAPNQYLAYTIDDEKGLLSEAERVVLPADSKPVDVAATPEERITFVLDGARNRIFAYRYLYATEPVMFELSRHGSPFSMAEGLAGISVDPTGRFGLVVSSDVASVSSYVMPGRWAPLKKVKGGTVSVGRRPVSVSISGNGRDVYVLDAGKSQIQQLQLNSRDGSLKIKGPAVTLDAQPAELIIDPVGQYAYVRYVSRAGLTRFEIDAAQGRLTHATEILREMMPSSLAFTVLAD